MIDFVYRPLVQLDKLLRAGVVAKNLTEHSQVARVLLRSFKIQINDGNIQRFDGGAVFLSLRALQEHQIGLGADELLHAGVALQKRFFGVMRVQELYEIKVTLDSVLKGDNALFGFREHIERVQDHQRGFARHRDALGKLFELHFPTQGVGDDDGDGCLRRLCLDGLRTG